MNSNKAQHTQETIIAAEAWYKEFQKRPLEARQALYSMFNYAGDKSIYDMYVAKEAWDSKQNARAALLETIVVLRNNKKEIKDQIKNMESNDYVCYFPSTFTSIYKNELNGQLGISGQLIPDYFGHAEATRICSRMINGHGEHPLAITKERYFPLFIEWIDEQILNVNQMIELC